MALIGYVGLYLPWFIYQNRTIFNFYTVAFAPFVVLALTLWLGAISGLIEPVPGSRLAAKEDIADHFLDIWRDCVGDIDFYSVLFLGR